MVDVPLVLRVRPIRLGPMPRERSAPLGGVRLGVGALVACALVVVACGGAVPAPLYIPPPPAPVVSAVAVEPTAPAPAPAPSLPPPCPPEMAYVQVGDVRVCVDKYEGALAEVADDGSTTPWHFSRSVDKVDRVFHAIPAKGFKPQVNISQLQAAAACHASGKRLCRLPEWTAACRGPSENLYPYGSTYRFGACNAGRPSPVASAREAAREKLRLHDPRIAERDNTIMSGGAHPLCVTDTGIFDLHGNVHEWIADTPKARKPYIGTFMGGFFADGRLNGEGCLYKTTAHSKEYHDYSTGFRCCKDAGDGAQAVSP